MWRGRPEWMSDALLDDLVGESIERRPDARLYEKQFLSCGGTRADRLAVSDELVALVEQASGPARPTGVASYLYYDEAGLGIVPHVDTEVFALNAIILLRHDAREAPKSHLVVFPPDSPATEVPLEPGDLVLMRADCVVHGRTETGPDEAVHVLTIGFQPPDADSTPFTL
jgi:hypothetical protein